VEYILQIAVITIGVKLGTLVWGGFFGKVKKKAQRAAEAVRAEEDDDA